MKKTTIFTLSKDLGVSPATISKALNNSPEISLKTAEKIRRAAQEKGFTPRPMASRTTNICALIQTPSADASCFAPYTIEVMQGMMDYLQNQELEFSLYSESLSDLNNGLILRRLGRRNINGAVLINTDEESRFYEEFDKNLFPYCNLLTNNGKTNRNLLTVDNTDAAFRAVEYLIQLGHRNIATIVTPAHNVTGKERLAGYKKAIEQARIPIDPSLIIRSEKDQNGLDFGHRRTLDLLKARPDVTAMLVMGEHVAIGAMHAISQLKLSIPQDISLITFDDAPEASYLNPPLTVMRIPNRKLGHAAARWVHDMITGANGHEVVNEPWMRGELVIRESTAPPCKK